jgi:hypothetical protein
MAENPALRVSDADREQICARLREAYAEGRLTAEEFHQRTDRALAARTGADLAPLTADLPAPAPLPLPANQLPQRRELRRIWTAWASMAILLNAVWILTAITSSDLPAYWPVWPLGITGALAVVRTLNVRNADADRLVPPADAARARRDRHDRRRAR